MDNGLLITDLGLQGLIVETQEPAYSLARARHARLQAAVEQVTDLAPGVRVLLVAIAEGIALHRATLDALVAIGSAQLYRGRAAFEVELDMGGGWRDRRQLPTSLIAAIRSNRGCVVSRKDWAAAEAAIRSVEGYATAKMPLDSAIADALAWWYAHLPGPLFAHVSRRRPFQVLDRAGRARIDSKQPQRSAEPKNDPLLAAARQAYDKCFVQSGDTSVIDELVKGLGRIARDKGAKTKGRDDMADLVQGLMSKALRAGRAQTLVLGGIAFVLVHGGVKGKPLAPVSMYEYCRQHLVGLTADLAKAGVDSRSGERWLCGYRQMLKAVPQSQQRKLDAFFKAFHSFLVLLGMERLPASILGHQPATPPAAASVCDHELGLALAFVRTHAESDEIAAQASIALLLGFEVELRTYELWCIRMVDVQLDHPPYLVIYPRLRDGAGKTPSLRRQVDLHGRALLRLLVAFKHKRRSVDHARDDEDLFFGTPGAPERRHEQDKTMRLVNAALVWATGNRVASFYDLRHTVFSRKAHQVLMQE